MRKNEENPSNAIPKAHAAPGTLRDFIETAYAVDLAAWLEEIPCEEAQEQLLALPLPRRTETFGYLQPDTQVALARRLDRRDLAEIVTQMNADDRADLFNHLTPKEQQWLLRGLAQEEREDIRRLSAYAEGTAGAIMTSDYATLAADMTAHEAIELLRREAPEKETIYRSYILDRERHLIGSIRLHQLILAAADTRIEEIMDHAPVSVALDSDQEHVARMIERYDLLALPVIDEDGRLVGIVTHDDAADAMQAETTEDFHKIATVLPFSQSVREASMGVLYRKRIFWLALLVFGNLFSGAGIAFFEDTILAYVSLVFFLPLLIDSSGNAGSQSATLMVRALATGDVALKDWRDLILRELLIALALGATMALLVFPVGLLRGDSEIALVVGLTMLLVVIVGSLAGMSLPFLLSRLRLDPATASAPLVTTISDAVGVLVYFWIATTVLSP
ncbi:Divalent cation transporter [Nitrosococcus oceani ATCC 19707]|uniref:Magnesium transporter MgtE n=1 Tax=Nitrosococcus oceani (strain ATCC 19707 / BCRC 17464 / JCM 30415 / NCIMB 11848 / C-107) TaxID=323261 RepID=Q3JA90_NITOC|nr:magnesium transporter [Nitrosococcus oceani]ABA58256.1 Divalent cation transporter [Nitrosococcus oceani ATCC 19707]GEM20478.1 magnesium transporter [Nitrosococcus oceani]